MAIPDVVPVAVRVWAILDPEDAVAPETPDWTTVQANVVPVTLLVRATDVAAPEHIVCEPGVAMATGMGLTVITTTFVVPLQPLDVGVTV